jgi:hypothetical protein
MQDSNKKDSWLEKIFHECFQLKDLKTALPLARRTIEMIKDKPTQQRLRTEFIELAIDKKEFTEAFKEVINIPDRKPYLIRLLPEIARQWESFNSVMPSSSDSEILRAEISDLLFANNHLDAALGMILPASESKKKEALLEKIHHANIGKENLEKAYQALNPLPLVKWGDLAIPFIQAAIGKNKLGVAVVAGKKFIDLTKNTRKGEVFGMLLGPTVENVKSFLQTKECQEQLDGKFDEFFIEIINQLIVKKEFTNARAVATKLTPQEMQNWNKTINEASKSVK